MEMWWSACAKIGDIRDILRARGQGDTHDTLLQRTTLRNLDIAPPRRRMLHHQLLYYCTVLYSQDTKQRGVERWSCTRFCPLQDSLSIVLYCMYAAKSDVMMTVRKGIRGLFKGLAFEWSVYSSDLDSWHDKTLDPFGLSKGRDGKAALISVPRSQVTSLPRHDVDQIPDESFKWGPLDWESKDNLCFDWLWKEHTETICLLILTLKGGKDTIIQRYDSRW